MEHISDVAQFALARGKHSFPFIFIDPTGWEQVDIDLITPILRLNPGEVLINLMTSWITRFLSDESKNWHRLVGSDRSKLASLQGEEREEQLVRSYSTRIQQAGDFAYVCTLPILKADQNSFHYHMIYATRHKRGIEVFKDVERSVIPFMHETRARAQSPHFLAGVDRVIKGAQTYRLALLCAEKEPLECHRTLLVSRELAALGVQVMHIHADGALETHEEAMSRLVKMLGLPETDLYRNKEEIIADACALQEERIAYVNAGLRQEAST